MPRCGCGQSSGGCACAFQTSDTSSVALVLAGLGSSGSPWNLSASVVLVPDGTGPLAPTGVNALKLDALGLYVESPAPGSGAAITTSFTPYLTLTSVNVQAAIQELYDEAVRLAGAQTITGLKTFAVAPLVPGDPMDPSWNGNMEAASKDDIYDAFLTGGGGTAASTTFAPYLTIAATDVQAAIEELYDEFIAASSLSTATPLAISIYTLAGVTFIDYIGSGGGGALPDNTTIFRDNVDATKQMRFELGGLNGGDFPILSPPAVGGEIATLVAAQTLSSKTLAHATLFGPTATLVAESFLGSLHAGGTINLNFATARRWGTLYDNGVTVFDQAAVVSVTSDASYIIGRDYRNASGVALSLGLLRGVDEVSAVIADAAAVTGSFTSFRAAAALSVAGGGTLAIASLQAFGVACSIGPGVTVTTANIHGSAPTVPGGVVTTLSHYKANNVTPSGGGSIPSMYGFSCDLLQGGAFNMGLRMAAATQYPVRAASIGAVGESLIDDAAVIATRYEITNTTGGSLTLTSTPTLPDGSDGQVVTILNVGAQNVVVQDQGTLAGSNLRLGAATRTLGPRDSIRLAWSTGIGDWVEEFFSNVV